MSKISVFVAGWALLTSACAGDSPYCCALGRMASDSDYQSDIRGAWSQMADAKNDEVCKTEFESQLENYSSIAWDQALAACADK
jgi:hypothetical protein